MNRLAKFVLTTIPSGVITVSYPSPDLDRNNLVISLDAMGGDMGPDAVIPGVAMALAERPDCYFLFYGREPDITPLLDKYPALKARSQVIHTDDVVSSEDKPSYALRNGRKSSMRLAINAVAEGKAHGVVSSGNTGALMAMAKIALRTLPGIHRPAIASVFPTITGETVVLDLGANIQADPENLAQFAVMGCVYARLLLNIQTPSTGVLNVGSEEMKGHDRVRGAATILSQVEFPGRYYGFVEGDDLTKGTVDVVVTDGFTGNIALKAAEGVARLMSHHMRTAFRSSLLSRIGYLCARPALARMKKALDPRYYNGGIFMGLGGICLKSHGGSDAYGFSRATIRAIDLVRNDFNARAVKEIEKMTSQESFFSLDMNGEG